MIKNITGFKSSIPVTSGSVVKMFMSFREKIYIGLLINIHFKHTV